MGDEPRLAPSGAPAITPSPPASRAPAWATSTPRMTSHGPAGHTAPAIPAPTATSPPSPSRRRRSPAPGRVGAQRPASDAGASGAPAWASTPRMTRARPNTSRAGLAHAQNGGPPRLIGRMRGDRPSNGGYPVGLPGREPPAGRRSPLFARVGGASGSPAPSKRRRSERGGGVGEYPAHDTPHPKPSPPAARASGCWELLQFVGGDD